MSNKQQNSQAFICIKISALLFRSFSYKEKGAEDTQMGIHKASNVVEHTRINPNVSTVNGTVDREASPKHWYVAQVQMKCEKKSAQRLAQLGHETFVPVRQEIHQWSDRRKKMERVLIPLLVFVYTYDECIKEIGKFSFVHRMLCAPGDKVPAIIPDEQIERFKFMLGHCDSEITIESPEIKIGDTVRIVRGSLRGLEGFVTEISDSKSKVSIMIDYIGYASIILDKNNLEIIK